jgi:cell division protein FtsZ
MAISNPLLDDVSMKGARGVLINITGGQDLMLFEVEQAANRIRAEVDPDANIIFGNTILDDMEGRIRVSVVATGIDAAEMRVGKNVEQFPSTRAKPRPIDMLKAAAASVAQQDRHAPVQQHVAPPPPQAPIMQQPVPSAANPVHRRVEQIETTLSVPEHEAVEAAILGGNEVVEPVMPQPEPVSYRPAREEMPPVHHAEPERKSGWGLFRSKKPKEEPRMEPAPRMSAPAPRPQAPRAMAQAEPARMAPQQQAPQGDDLFPDHKRDDFEIPAFLRRQTN